MTYPEGWHMASDERAEQLADKLSLTIGQHHFLYGKRLQVVAYQHRDNVDELLCQHPEEEDLFSLVHMVWSLTSSEAHRASPIVELHGCFQDFLNYERVVQDRIVPEEVDLLKDAEQRGEALGKQWGIQIGENRGLAVGERQGQVKLLARQLCRRFRVTPTDAMARLNAASSEQFEQWTDNILTAQTLEQVFEYSGE